MWLEQFLEAKVNTAGSGGSSSGGGASINIEDGWGGR